MTPEPIQPEQHLLALTVNADGYIELHHSAMCDHLAAHALRAAAAALEARHGAQPCRPPLADLDGENLPAVPLGSGDGRLDRERKVWHDSTGHAWDLSLDWIDSVERVWRWTGRLAKGDRAPIMRALDDSGETEPLDVLCALYRPIAPLAPAGGEQR